MTENIYLTYLLAWLFIMAFCIIAWISESFYKQTNKTNNGDKICHNKHNKQ